MHQADRIMDFTLYLWLFLKHYQCQSVLTFCSSVVPSVSFRSRCSLTDSVVVLDDETPSECRVRLRRPVGEIPGV